MEKREYSFYQKEINMERVEEVLRDVAGKLSLYEILKMTREIVYDVVAYYGEDKKGKIYDGSYTRKQISQATDLQRRLSETCDLFSQVVLSNREFEDDYIELFTQSRAIINSYKSKINTIRKEVNTMLELAYAEEKSYISISEVEMLQDLVGGSNDGK